MSGKYYCEIIVCIALLRHLSGGIQMVHLNVIEARLSKLGIRCGWLSRPELIELQHILMDEEQIVSLANGRYFAGFATLVATDVRLLIIDKRPFFMTYEDIRYDMVSQLDYTARLDRKS